MSDVRCSAVKAGVINPAYEYHCQRKATHGEWCRQHAESLGGWRLQPPPVRDTLAVGGEWRPPTGYWCCASCWERGDFRANSGCITRTSGPDPEWERIATIAAPPSDPAAPLDVERLAEALLRVVPGYQRWLAYPGTPTMADMDARSEAAHTEALAHAGRIAREYAALATPEEVDR